MLAPTACGGGATRATPSRDPAPPNLRAEAGTDRFADLAHMLFDAPGLVVWLTGQGPLGRPGADGAAVVPDAVHDRRLTGGPLVVGGRRFHFYVAAPLSTPLGGSLGTLHVALPDPRPEHAAADDRRRMAALAGVVAEVLDAQTRLRMATEALAEKDLLAREADHRVANGLQLIHGALSLQASAEPSVASSAALRVAADRVAAVAGAHRHLHRAAEALPDTAAYLKALVLDLVPPPGAAGNGATDRKVLLDAEPGAAAPAGLLPRLGLIAAELIANALKHGTGRILVELSRAPPAKGEGVVLAVSDEGPGFPQGFDPASSGRKGLGMRLVAALSQPGGVHIDPGDRRRIVVCLVNRLAPGGPR